MVQDPNISQYLHSMQYLSPKIKIKDLVEFGKNLIVKTFKAKEVIFKSHEIQEYVLFVTKGLARSFYISENGDEKTSWFIAENDFITDYPSFLSGRPSQYCFETLEETTVVYLPKKAIYDGYDKYPEVQKYGRLVAELTLQSQQERIESLLFKSATDRYVDFIDTSKHIVNRVSQEHLASYIGIKRQSLTRIRKQLLLGK